MAAFPFAVFQPASTLVTRMTIPLQRVEAVPLSTTALRTNDFDQRWTAWQARGVARDGIVHRRMAFAAPVLFMVLMFALWLLGR